LFGQQGARICSVGAEAEPAVGQCLPAVAVGEQSEVADLDEAGGQDMEQEAADELDSFEAHDAAAVAMPGVPPAEAHLSVFEAEQPSVGDGDAMRVAGQILQHMFRSSEGRLGVDHPLCSAQGAKQSVKCAWRCQFGQLAGEAEFAALVVLLEEGEQLAAVTIARAMTNTFSGIRPIDVPGFILSQFAGALAASFFLRWLQSPE